MPALLTKISIVGNISRTRSITARTDAWSVTSKYTISARRPSARIWSRTLWSSTLRCSKHTSAVYSVSLQTAHLCVCVCVRESGQLPLYLHRPRQARAPCFCQYRACTQKSRRPYAWAKIETTTWGRDAEPKRVLCVLLLKICPLLVLHT